ncbi:spore cortex biosynthesis protein YabQ [Mangrovibacillus cuniculi]|uniref:Spore cortex biosynthesis protein YabQ n=1 Tax=Mangrovibacillus cuniculi TaxID=2593652 RepID=A0A7S8CDH7_9BACI|nr:spore cortex biosynthesis protein YabQ [Mangrovibacillus cuniculi]QPC47985.1 spore cortex biosynthesis protein YabQ [Mangrovibacillus cuniculi]
MSMTIPVQLATLLSMIAMGSVFGILLDTYQRFIQRSRRARWIVFLHDIMFWLLQALLVFYVLFVVNYGEIRLYLFLAILCGFSSYQALLKNWYTDFLERVISLTIAIAKWVKRMIYLMVFSPIKGLILFIISIILLLGRTLWKLVLVLLGILKWVILVALLPVKWIFQFLWFLLPKSLKKFVVNYYNKAKGLWSRYRQYMYKVYLALKNKWKK